MKAHDDSTCDVCALFDLTLTPPLDDEDTADCASTSTMREQPSLGDRLADVRSSVSDLEWHYCQLISSGNIPGYTFSARNGAGHTLTGVIAALGQMRRALEVADSALTTARSHSSRLTCTRETP